MTVCVDVQILRLCLAGSMKCGVGNFFGGNYGIQFGRCALASVRGASHESRLAGLIPERDARIIVLPLVPAIDLLRWVLVRGDPAVVLECHLDALVKNQRVADVPAVGAGMAAHDAPLVEVRHAEMGCARRLQAPCAEEVILSAGAPDRCLFFSVDIDFLIALSEPG